MFKCSVSAVLSMDGDHDVITADRMGNSAFSALSIALDDIMRQLSMVSPATTKRTTDWHLLAFVDPIMDSAESKLLLTGQRVDDQRELKRREEVGQ